MRRLLDQKMQERAVENAERDCDDQRDGQHDETADDGAKGVLLGRVCNKRFDIL